MGEICVQKLHVQGRHCNPSKLTDSRRYFDKAIHQKIHTEKPIEMCKFASNKMTGLNL